MALVLCAVVLGVLAVARDLEGFLESVGRIGPDSALLAFVLAIAGLLVSGEAWRSNVRSVVGPLDRAAARRVFFVSQLGKYLPGALWPAVAQIDSARRAGLSGSRMGVAFLLFLALHLLTGLVVAVGLMPWAAPELLRAYPWTPGLLILLAVVLVPPVLTRVIDRALRIIRRPTLTAPLGLRDVAEPSAQLLVTWAFYGLAAVALTAPIVGSVDLRLVALSTGGFALAWVVGVVIVLAPAGVGAREIVLLLALSPMLGTTEATSVVIVLRVVHTVADLLLAAVGGRGGRGGSG